MIKQIEQIEQNNNPNRIPLPEMCHKDHERITTELIRFDGKKNKILAFTIDIDSLRFLFHTLAARCFVSELL